MCGSLVPERDYRPDQDRGGQPDQGQQEAPSHRESASRNPRPYTVSISLGCPSFLRSDATCTSRTFIGPYQCASQARSMISWRVTTRPGSLARHSRMPNSLGVSDTSRPPPVTLPVRRTTTTAPCLHISLLFVVLRPRPSRSLSP